MRIGIPRALLYYWYGELWERFWRECGLEVITSPPTDRSILALGTEKTLDEVCLPVKIFLGHLRYLAPRVDFIFLPHLIKVEPDAYICPKFMGLPDMARMILPENHSMLLRCKVGPRQLDQLVSLRNTALHLGISSRRRIATAVKAASGFFQASDSHIFRLIPESQGTRFTIGLFGHPYCLFDSFFNRRLLEQLAAYQVRVVTPEMIPVSWQGKGAGRLAKPMFWSVGKKQFDALEWMLSPDSPGVDAMIHLAPFACGPEAVVGDMLERRIHAAGRPFLRLNIEEHSGEAGIITRLEAFLDLIEHRQRVASC